MANSKENRLKFSFKSSPLNESSSKQVNVELIFLSSISKKYCCSLCQNLLRDPCQVSCCKSAYCRACIERLNATTGKCSNIKCGKTYSVISDGAVEDLNKKIQQLRVYCIKRVKGCKWSGTLEQLEQTHFRANYDEKDIFTCQYQTVKCPNDCGEMLLRGKVREHRFSECKKEMCVCEYCGIEESKAHIRKIHHRVCPAVPVECPNKCKNPGVARADILSHLEEQCPLRLVYCSYRHVGCNDQIQFKDVSKHNMESYQKHLDFMSEKLEFVSNENRDLRIENDSLHEEIASLLSKMKDYRYQSVDSLRDSYIFMEAGVHIRPLLPAVPQPSTSTLPDSQAQPSPEGTESGYGSVNSAPFSRKSLEKIIEKRQRSGTSVDQDSSPGFGKLDPEPQATTGRIIDEGNVYEDLDDDKFDKFRNMGSPAGREMSQSSGGDISGVSSLESKVPLPELPPKPPLSRSSASSNVNHTSQYSTYDVPVRHHGHSHTQEDASQRGRKTTRSFSAPSTSEQAHSGVYNNTPKISGIYEDMELLVQGNDYIKHARQDYTTPTVNPVGLKDERIENVTSPTNLAYSTPTSSRAWGDSIGKKSDTSEVINIPVIQLQSPSKDDSVLLALEEEEEKEEDVSSDLGTYENTSKMRRDRRAAPLINTRKQHKQSRSTNQSTHAISVNSTPVPRSRSSTVGDMRSLKNITINHKLVEAVKPGTFKVFEDHNAPPTGTPVLPPRSSPGPDVPESRSTASPSVDEIASISTDLVETGSDSNLKSDKVTKPTSSTGSKHTSLTKTASKFGSKFGPEARTKSPTFNIASLHNITPKPVPKTAVSNSSKPGAKPKPQVEPNMTAQATPPQTGSKPPIAPKTAPRPTPGSRQRIGSDAGSKFSMEALKGSLQSLKHTPLHTSASLPHNVKPSLIKELTSKLLKDQRSSTS